jgi:hypothetical protein
MSTKPLRATLAAVSMCVMLLLVGGTVRVVTAYSCGNPSTGHCYGTVTWSQRGEYFGAFTEAAQVPLSCPAGCGGFVDDEVWLIDASSSGCTSNGFGVCWVEAGSIAVDGAEPVFFWADARPTKTSTFNLHLLGATDPVGTLDHYMIVKDGRPSPQTFLVFIYTDSFSTLYNGVSSLQSGPPMSAHRIDLGQELAGTKGASAGTANLVRNIWAVQALGPEYVFWYNRQTTQGTVTSANPPTASWTINPSNPPPPEGGQFTTRCCK